MVIYFTSVLFNTLYIGDVVKIPGSRQLRANLRQRKRDKPQRSKMLRPRQPSTNLRLNKREKQAGSKLLRLWKPSVSLRLNKREKPRQQVAQAMAAKCQSETIQEKENKKQRDTQSRGMIKEYRRLGLLSAPFL